METAFPSVQSPASSDECAKNRQTVLDLAGRLTGGSDSSGEVSESLLALILHAVSFESEASVQHLWAELIAGIRRRRVTEPQARMMVPVVRQITAVEVQLLTAVSSLRKFDMHWLKREIHVDVRPGIHKLYISFYNEGRDLVARTLKVTEEQQRHTGLALANLKRIGIMASLSRTEDNSNIEAHTFTFSGFGVEFLRTFGLE